jgi:hypothetical protein
MTKRNSVPAKASGHHTKDFLQRARLHPGRGDDGEAFLPDPAGGPARSRDDLAQEVAEGFLASATSGEETGEDMANVEVPEEEGGPFIETSARDEFGFDPDPSNPEDAEAEPFPLANGR